MSTDLYAKCPCGSGKKIKFCCKDIISDIERIERMLKGEQRSAALEKINKLLEKHTDRPALLSLKAQVFLELRQFDDAEPVISRLLDIEPAQPTALAMQALILSVRGDTSGSLRMLHRAFRFSDGVLTQMVYRSYVLICMHLIQRSQFVSAYAHLLTLVSITKGQDRASLSMLMEVTSSERLPAIFQGLVISDDAPEHVTWKREFDAAIEMYRRGDWSEAASMMADMNRRILDEPVLLRNQAILQAWTCQEEDAIKAFRYFAAIRDVDLQAAVEAEACAQVLEPTDPADLLDIVAITHEIDDAEAMMERLLSDNRVASLPVRRDEDSDAPPPKGQFVFFDRPMLDPQEPGDKKYGVADLPREVCSATVFGKETDRSARFVIMGIQDDGIEQALKLVSEITGEAFTSTSGAEKIGEIHKVERLLRPNFRGQAHLSIDENNAVQQEWIARQLIEGWPELSLAQFEGKSASQAASEKKLQRRVLAAILNLEIWADRQPFDIDFDDLRSKLDLPVSTPIDPNEVNIRNLSPTQLHRLQLDKLVDEDLKFLFEIISVRPNGKLMYRIGKEVLNRPHMGELMDLVEVHERLADLAPTSDEQLEHLSKARDLAVSDGESPATWLVSELDLRILRGEADTAKRLLAEIQSRYMKEPGVAQMLGGVLSKYGLMPPTGGAPPTVSAQAAPAEAAATAPTAGGGVWTPDQPASETSGPAGGQEGAGKSKLWVPGMD